MRSSPRRQSGRRRAVSRHRPLGPERAAYATVTAPLVALAVSTGLEGYAWSAWAVLGVPLVVLGNVAVFAPMPRVLAGAKSR